MRKSGCSQGRGIKGSRRQRSLKTKGTSPPLAHRDDPIQVDMDSDREWDDIEVEVYNTPPLHSNSLKLKVYIG